MSSQQREMCAGPSTNGVMLKRFTYKDTHNRTIVLCTADSDHEHSYCRCSYVASTTMGSSHVHVGRIMTLFEHTFLSTTTTFAYISWLDGPYLDTDSNLHFTLVGPQGQSLLPVSKLSKPLVTAEDDEEVGKLWILNL